jgi:hypothetical protein
MEHFFGNLHRKNGVEFFIAHVSYYSASKILGFPDVDDSGVSTKKIDPRIIGQRKVLTIVQGGKTLFDVDNFSVVGHFLLVCSAALPGCVNTTGNSAWKPI